MPARVDQKVFQAILAAHRAEPGNHSRAARDGGVTRRTARRAWVEGYPGTGWGDKPVSQLIVEEQAVARGRTELATEQGELREDREALERERAAEAVRQNAIRSKEMEAAMINGLRGVTSQALVAALRAVPGVQKVMTKMGEQLVTMGESGAPLTRHEMGDVMVLMRRYSSSVRELSMAAMTAMEMERLYLGDPDTHRGAETEFDSMPMEELVRAANVQQGILQRAADRGLVVLDGGLTAPADKKASGN